MKMVKKGFALLIVAILFAGSVEAQNSVAARQLERYQDAEDEGYGFVNEYPDSKNRALAERIIERCKKFTKDANENE